MDNSENYGKYFADVGGGNSMYFDTQKKAIKYAKKWAKIKNEQIAVYKYHNPKDIRIGMDLSDACVVVDKHGMCSSLYR